MSYGWLTESALLPQPSKPIDVPAASMAQLRDVLYTETHQSNENRGQTGSSMHRPTAKKITSEQRRERMTNQGIEERRARDANDDGDDGRGEPLAMGKGDGELTETQLRRLLAKSARRMEHKAKLYDELLQSGTAEGCREDSTAQAQCLVDFEAKKAALAPRGESPPSLHRASAGQPVTTPIHVSVEDFEPKCRSNPDTSSRTGICQLPETLNAKKESIEFRAALTEETDRVRQQMARDKQGRDELRSRLESLRKAKRSKKK